MFCTVLWYFAFKLFAKKKNLFQVIQWGQNGANQLEQGGWEIKGLDDVSRPGSMSVDSYCFFLNYFAP